MSFGDDLLHQLSIGLVIIDSNNTIRLWNRWMEKKTGFASADAEGQQLYVVSPRFGEDRYRKIIESVCVSRQGRFLAGAIHGALFAPEGEVTGVSGGRQNIQIEVIERSGKPMLLIQVMDVTGHYQKVQQMRSFIRTLESENDEMRQIEQTARSLALHDVLTGLPNRLSFNQHMKWTLHNLKYDKEIFAVVFLDIDGFKAVNDRFGHATGDEVLSETGRRLRGAVRGTDFVARLAGDEFTIILHGIKQKADVVTVAMKIAEQFRVPIHVKKDEISISCSFGISFFPDDGDSADVLMDKADQALYRVKRTGKNGFAIFGGQPERYML